MRILIACEESQTVTKAFRAKGHEAMSCDLLDTERPGPHYKGNVLDVLYSGWDMMVAHPPCTYFSRAGIQFLHKQPDRYEKLLTSFEFVKTLWSAPIDKICIENPVGWLNTHWRKPNQKFHPWYFGDGEMKETCLWLKNLPRLMGSMEVAIAPWKHKPVPASSRMGSDGKMKNKYFMSRMNTGKDRAKTFPNVARAMADQWI